MHTFGSQSAIQIPVAIKKPPIMFREMKCCCGRSASLGLGTPESVRFLSPKLTPVTGEEHRVPQDKAKCLSWGFALQMQQVKDCLLPLTPYEF